MTLLADYALKSHRRWKIQNFFLGSGININKNFSAGINMSLFFGNVRR